MSTMIKVRIAPADKCGGEYSAFLSFSYDSKIIDIIKALPDRYWNTKNREWELPIRKFPTIVDKLQDYEFSITGQMVSERPATVAVPKNFVFKTNPFQHQIEGFNYGLSHDRWLLGDEQGLGKTKQVIDIAVAKKLSSGYKHCLIICGVNGLKWNWVKEIKTHSNESGWILGQRQKKNGAVRIGSSEAKLADLRAIDQLDDYFIITNVESLRMKEKTGRKVNRRGKLVDEYRYPITDQILELCETGEIGMIAFDEIHKCKNPDSDQGAQLLRLTAKSMIAMTGTPLMNSPLDLYVILKWLKEEKHSFYQFKNHYCTMGGYGGYEVVGYRNLDELHERLDDLMLRRLKDDVLDLPEKLYIDEYVEMTPKQEQIYKEVTAEIKANIDNIKMVNNPLAELIRMRQATGYTGILSSTVQESAKLDRMEDLVEEAVQNGKKVVIFSNWTQMTDVIRARLAKKYKGVVITGQTNDAERQVNVNHFQNNPECKYIIGTIGAMGTGLTLTAGTVEIFMDEPWNKANKEQAEDRCHRVGTTSNVTIYTLLCKNTIDERIHDLVMQKGEMASRLVDGKIVGDKRELLEYLIN